LLDKLDRFYRVHFLSSVSSLLMDNIITNKNGEMHIFVYSVVFYVLSVFMRGVKQ